MGTFWCGEHLLPMETDERGVLGVAGFLSQYSDLINTCTIMHYKCMHIYIVGQ